MAILGRQRNADLGPEKTAEEKLEFVRDLVQAEMGGTISIEQLWRTWMRSSGSLLKSGQSGH